jgi:hypothetical protein
MDEYRKLQKVKRRGSHCKFSVYDEEKKVERSVLCGCGCRDPISKNDNNRIVRRELQIALRKECEDL